MDRVACGDFTELDAESYIGDEETIHNLLESVDDETRNLLFQFANGALAQLRRMSDAPAARNLEEPAQKLDELLDSLTNTNAALMTPTSAESGTLLCTICLETYLTSDTVVVLPCHTFTGRAFK